MLPVESQVVAAHPLWLEFRARARVAGIHLLLSALAVASVLAPLVAVLFPGPYFHLAGAVGLILLVVAVDLVMGPGLTFLVAARGKPAAVLRRDIAAIVLLQLAALSFGMHSIVLGRPVFITFAVDRFELVAAAEVDASELERAAPEFRTLSWAGPILVGARRSDDPLQRQQLLLASATGIDLKHLISTYVAYDRIQQDALARSKSVGELMRFNSTASVARALSAEGATASERLRWLPVRGKHEDQVALIDARSGQLVRLVRLAPW